MNQLHPFYELVRLFPAFETIYSFCHCTRCNTCPLYAVCEGRVFMSGHTLEDLAIAFLEHIDGDFIETYGLEELEE